jgi:hypothetical protein
LLAAAHGDAARAIGAQHPLPRWPLPRQRFWSRSRPVVKPASAEDQIGPLSGVDDDRPGGARKSPDRADRPMIASAAGPRPKYGSCRKAPGHQTKPTFRTDGGRTCRMGWFADETEFPAPTRWPAARRSSWSACWTQGLPTRRRLSS